MFPRKLNEDGSAVAGALLASSLRLGAVRSSMLGPVFAKLFLLSDVPDTCALTIVTSQFRTLEAQSEAPTSMLSDKQYSETLNW